MTVSWFVTPSSLVEVYGRFRGACALMMVAASTSKTSVNFHQTTRRNNPEDSHLHRLEGLWSGHEDGVVRTTGVRFIQKQFTCTSKIIIPGCLFINHGQFCFRQFGSSLQKLEASPPHT
jgi:hypothetical protein